MPSASTRAMAGWPRAAARSASASGKAAASRKLNALLACSSTNFTQPSPRRALRTSNPPSPRPATPCSARTAGPRLGPNIYSVVDGFEAPAAAVAREPAERAVVQLHVPLVLDEGRFRPPFARHAPRPRARDDPPRQPAGAEVSGRSRVKRDVDGSRRPHAAHHENGPLSIQPSPHGFALRLELRLSPPEG